MKRDRTVIGRVVLSLAVMALTLALNSCTQEPVGVSMPGGDGLEVRVTFSRNVATRTTTRNTEIGPDNENRLDRVTILVFNKDGTKLESVLSEDVTSGNGSLATSQPKWASEGILVVSPIQNPSSPKIIYAVANWDKTEFNKATYTEAMLLDEVTTITAVADINGAKAYPMLMSGRTRVESLSSPSYVTVDMMRQVSKLRTLFTIPIAVQNYLPQIQWLGMGMDLMNIANKSYVISTSDTPSGMRLLNEFMSVDDSEPGNDDQTVPATKDLRWEKSVYIFENLVPSGGDAASTYIVLHLPYFNRTTGKFVNDNYYKLSLKDNNSNAASVVHRNTIYTLNVKILGMGLPYNTLLPYVNIEDQLTVNSWEKGEIGDVEAPNHFFNIDRTYIDFQSFETSFRSTINTDVPDWKLVKADGATLFSFAEGKTEKAVIDSVTYTLSGNVSRATVTVDKPAGLTNFPNNKMTFVAKNLKVPFTVVSDNGFIPNSVLIAAGWPADKLPPTGLQIAKRGNKVPPYGVAVSEDPSMQWKISRTSTGGTAEGLGMGVSSTAAMAGAEHPAAQHCRDMGKGWFLPSREELRLIDKSKSTLGISYLIEESYYWCSSEYPTGEDSWYMYFHNMGALTTFNSKLIEYKVRCMKAI